MKFKEIVSVTGVSGLKRVIGTRNDGLIVSDLDGNNKKFLSSRLHMFSPLENISIYTYEDSVPLLEVFLKMKGTEVVDANADEAALKGYLESILPDFDKDRVHKGDIKKLIKWFHILNEFDLIQPAEAAETSVESSAE